MPENFIHKNFYLQSPLAEELYHTYAKDLPLVDFHNHLNPEDLATNKKFANLAEAWLIHDPYKHRAMRICGVPENEITGDASDEQKFLKWAETVSKTAGNPLFLWSALELKRIFGIDKILNKNNATQIWEQCNIQLQQTGFGAADILKKFNAEILCTSDDLLDDLSVHQKATADQQIKVYPSLRGDSAVNIEQPGFKNWLEKLEKITGQQIKTWDDFKSAITQQLDKFYEAGCRLADHSLDGGFKFKKSTEADASEIFKSFLSGNIPIEKEPTKYKNYMLHFLGTEYSRRGWTLQLHIGAQRFTSSRLRKLAGPAGGYATVGSSCDIAGLCSFFDEMEKKDRLPKIILYTLNPSDNEAFATLTGSFSEDGVPGKIQVGPGWWYNDQYEGIRQHLTTLSSYGLLSQFIGMTTDSRSVFSFSRHEYFRRILCNQLAEWVDRGKLPNDTDLLSNLIKDICYNNSKNRFKDI
ncbi:MAG: glucuronate isomerase [Tangfeifania sp.]